MISLQPELLADLRAQATAAAHHAYAPYSRFRVGAALLLDASHTDQIITGCNVENSSYRLTSCAEQVAIGRAVAIANLNHAASMPCGACRQTLLEFAPDPATLLILFPGHDSTGHLTNQTATLADLLPAAFRLPLPPA